MREIRVLALVAVGVACATIAAADISLQTDRQFVNWIESTYRPNAVDVSLQWHPRGLLVERTIRTVVAERIELIARSPRPDGCCEFELARYVGDEAFGQLIRILLSKNGDVVAERRSIVPVAYLNALSFAP